MAHQTEIVINGVTTEVTEFDHTAQEIDDGIDKVNTLTGDDIKTSASDNTPIGDVVSVLGGATTPQAALANLGAGVRPSLLVNGDFRAGHVVNQRGQTSYATNGYTLDMWRMNGGTLAIDVDGISFTSGYVISQKMDGIDLSDGIARTVSYMDSDGDVYSGILGAEYSDIGDFSFTYDAGDALYVMSKNNAKKIRAMKLEEGDTQTLAYQDDTGAWQLLPQPESDYATQLAKCQRYLYSPYYGAATTTPIGAVFVSNPTTGFVQVDLPNQMRIKPVFFGEPSKLWIVKSTDGGAQHPSALSVMGMSGCAVFMLVTASFDTGGSYIMYSEDVSNPFDFLLSAEL